MYHNEIMRSVMDQRARDLRTSARKARDARVSRRARKFWAETAERQRNEVRRPGRHTRPQAASATGR
jgi:hypothetical protein